MQTQTITLQKFIADEGKYFFNETSKVICTQLFLGKNDKIENYKEIDESEKAEIEAKWEEERKAEEEKMGQDTQNE